MTLTEKELDEIVSKYPPIDNYVINEKGSMIFSLKNEYEVRISSGPVEDRPHKYEGLGQYRKKDIALSPRR